MEDLIGNNLTVANAKDLITRLENLNYLLQCNIKSFQSVTSDLVDVQVLEEIKNILSHETAFVYFGKNLKDIKIVIEDDELRKHEVIMSYKSQRKLLISSTSLPHFSIDSRDYECVNHVISVLRQKVNELGKYFYELETIDQFCKVMEPIHATFKDDYRKIFLDERTWLHIEVTPEGLATNIHLIGQSELWHNKLQAGLLNWDHDKNIVDNILTIFDLTQFPEPASAALEQNKMDTEENSPANLILCGICLCSDLPDTPGMPLPLCQNTSCGVYYHRNCLYQWLVACAGNRAPAFGVANGACPTCLQAISCNEKDN